jgi:hypothetical protein
MSAGQGPRAAGIEARLPPCRRRLQVCGVVPVAEAAAMSRRPAAPKAARNAVRRREITQ